MTVGPPDFIDSDDAYEPPASALKRPANSTWPESSTYAQRVIKLIIDAGVRWYGQPVNQGAIRRACMFLEAEELETMKALVRQRPLKVVHGFPRSLANLPVLAIILGSETPASEERFIGDYAQVGEDLYGDVGGGYVDTFSVGFDDVIRLVIYAENPDVTIFWYELTKFILIQSRIILASIGIDLPTFSGKDLSPFKTDEAELVYSRQIQLAIRTRQAFAQESGLISSIQMAVNDAATRLNVAVEGPNGFISVGE